MAAIERDTATSMTTSNGILSLAATMPTSVLNDLLIAEVANGSTAAPTHTPPAGWTLVGTANDGGGGGYVTTSVYKRTATGSEPSTYTFSTNESASSRLNVIIHSYSGAGDIDASSFLPQATSSTSRPTDSLTLSEERTVIAVFAGRNGETWTDPAGTTRLGVQAGTNTSILAVDDRHAAGSVSFAATASAASSTGIAILLVLTDAVVSDPPVIDVERPADNIVDLRDSTTGDLSTATFPTPVRVSGPTLIVTSLATGLWLFTQDAADPSVYTVRVNQTDGQYDTENVTISALLTGPSSNIHYQRLYSGVWS